MKVGSRLFISDRVTVGLETGASAERVGISPWAKTAEEKQNPMKERNASTCHGVDGRFGTRKQKTFFILSLNVLYK